MAPCRHAIQKHFKICPRCFLGNISERAWDLIYVRERELEYTSYILQFTLKLSLCPESMWGENKSRVPIFPDFIKWPNGRIFAILFKTKRFSVSNFLCFHLLRQSIKKNFFLIFFLSIFYYIPAQCSLKETVYVDGGYTHTHIYVFLYILKKRKLTGKELQK